jgi:aspartyl protease family protein
MRALMISAIGFGVLLGVGWPVDRPAPAEAVTASVPRKTVVERSGGGAFYVTALVNGEPVEFIIDTGAELVALSKADAARAKVAFDEAHFRPIAQTASGVAKGENVHIASVELDGKRRDDVGGMVIEGLDRSLLGQNFLRRLDGVEMRGDKMILR